MRERDVDRLFVSMAKELGITVYKTSSVMCRGFADRTLFGPGRRHGYVELKAHGQKLTYHQNVFIALAAVSGCFARVLRGGLDRESTKRAIRRVLSDYMEQ